MPWINIKCSGRRNGPYCLRYWTISAASFGPIKGSFESSSSDAVLTFTRAAGAVVCVFAFAAGIVEFTPQPDRQSSKTLEVNKMRILRLPFSTTRFSETPKNSVHARSVDVFNFELGTCDQLFKVPPPFPPDRSGLRRPFAVRAEHAWSRPFRQCSRP